MKPSKKTMKGQGEQNTFAYIPLELIDRDLNQPRKRFGRSALEELAASMRVHGVIQPIEVTATAEGRYTINHGERRWRAAQLADLETIPAVIAPHRPERERLIRQIMENANREDLAPCDEARSYAELAANGMSVNAIARQLNTSEGTIRARMALLKLEPEIQDLVDEGKISKAPDVTAALLSIPSVDARLQLARKLAGKKTSIKGWVRAAETVRNALIIPKPDVAKKAEDKRLFPVKSGRPPMVRVAAGGKGEPADNAVVSGLNVHEAARKMCRECMVRPQGLEFPAWDFIQQQATEICKACEQKNGPALPIVCQNCPGVALLSRLVSAARPAPAQTVAVDVVKVNGKANGNGHHAQPVAI